MFPLGVNSSRPPDLFPLTVFKKAPFPDFLKNLVIATESPIELLLFDPPFPPRRPSHRTFHLRWRLLVRVSSDIPPLFFLLPAVPASRRPMPLHVKFLASLHSLYPRNRGPAPLPPPRRLPLFCFLSHDANAMIGQPASMEVPLESKAPRTLRRPAAFGAGKVPSRLSTFLFFFFFTYMARSIHQPLS